MCHGEKASSKEEENGQDHLKWKPPTKERLGDRLEKKYKGLYKITEDNSNEKMANEIYYSLQEPEKDVIVQVVSIIGNKKAFELLMKTVEVEQNGGLLIMNGS